MDQGRNIAEIRSCHVWNLGVQLVGCSSDGDDGGLTADRPSWRHVLEPNRGRPEEPATYTPTQQRAKTASLTEPLAERSANRNRRGHHRTRRPEELHAEWARIHLCERHAGCRTSGTDREPGDGSIPSRPG